MAPWKTTFLYKQWDFHFHVMCSSRSWLVTSPPVFGPRDFLETWRSGAKRLERKNTPGRSGPHTCETLNMVGTHLVCMSDRTDLNGSGPSEEEEGKGESRVCGDDFSPPKAKLVEQELPCRKFNMFFATPKTCKSADQQQQQQPCAFWVVFRALTSAQDFVKFVKQGASLEL